MEHRYSKLGQSAAQLNSSNGELFPACRENKVNGWNLLDFIFFSQFLTKYLPIHLDP
jgi:hypothetical protein